MKQNNYLQLNKTQKSGLMQKLFTGAWLGSVKEINAAI